MNVKQNLDKTVTKAKCKADIIDPVTKNRMAQFDFKMQVNLPAGHRLELDPANLMRIETKPHLNLKSAQKKRKNCP